MKRLGLSVVAVLSLAACLDQTSTTSSSRDDVTVSSTGGTTLQSKGGSGIVPIVWSPSEFTRVSDYWSGDGGDSPAKVMIWLQTGALPDANGNPTASYFWLIAGAPDGTNKVFRIYTVANVYTTRFQSSLRANLNLHESEPDIITGVWDGGAGNGGGGTPIHPLGGPGGAPVEDVNAAVLAAAAFRNYYFNFAQTSAQY
jgi:hypothetical protein